MSKFYYTSDDLIESVKRRALVPSGQSTFTNDDFLAFANEEMNLGMVPTVVTMHEDYFLFTEEITLEAGKTNYPIPYRAIGNKLREVSFLDSNGNIFEMTRIGIGDLPFYNGPYTYNRVYAFYLQNNDIMLVPQSINITNGTKLRVTYYIRPNSLVLLENVAPILSINDGSTPGTKDIMVSNLPENYTTSQMFDLVKVKSPHKCVKIELTALAVNTTTKIITFNETDIPSELSVGDHICLATESAIPQIPSDLHVVLAHRVATRVLEALGDTEGLQNANLKLAELEKKTESLIDNRVEDAPKKVVNRHATLRRGLFQRRFRVRG